MKIVRIELNRNWPQWSSCVAAESIYGFFEGFFIWMAATQITPEILCGGRFDVTVLLDNGLQEDYISPDDFIAATYHAMCLWHDGKKGYELLCAVGAYYHPGSGYPMSEIQPILDLFDDHFKAGGEVV